MTFLIPNVCFLSCFCFVITKDILGCITFRSHKPYICLCPLCLREIRSLAPCPPPPRFFLSPSPLSFPSSPSPISHLPVLISIPFGDMAPICYETAMHQCPACSVAYSSHYCWWLHPLPNPQLLAAVSIPIHPVKLSLSHLEVLRTFHTCC